MSLNRALLYRPLSLMTFIFSLAVTGCLGVPVTEVQSHHSALTNSQEADYQSFNLGESRLFSISVTLPEGFRGPAHLLIDDTELRSVDFSKTVHASVPSSIVNVSGKNLVVVVSVSVDSMAPSLSSNLKLVVSETNQTNPSTAVVKIPLEVQAVYEVRLMGGGLPEAWSAPATASFARHTEGLTLRFINADMISSHSVVLTDGVTPIKSAELLTALSPENSRVWEVTVSGQSPVTQHFYCSDHEMLKDAHALNFNVNSTVKAPIQSNNPNATYHYIAANILPNCTGCHGGAAGFSFNSYAASMGGVVSLNSTASPLYYTIGPNGSMPPSGLKITAMDQAAVRDWINDGAKNN